MYNRELYKLSKCALWYKSYVLSRSGPGERSMADTITGAGERVEAHMRKVLAKLKALKDRQPAHDGPLPNGSLDSAVEVDREDDPSDGIGGVQRPA
jgi:hypothetical protein